MPIISVKDNENNRWKRNAKKFKKKNKGDGSYSERVRGKWFCWAFKLDFLQLISTDSLIFKSNLEFALSIILKERELYESKHAAVERRCLKIWLVTLFDMFLNPSLKMTASFVNVARTTEMYILGKIWNHQELGLYMKNNF